MSLWYIYIWGLMWYIIVRWTHFLVFLYSFTDFSENIPLHLPDHLTRSWYHYHLGSKVDPDRTHTLFAGRSVFGPTIKKRPIHKSFGESNLEKKSKYLGHHRPENWSLKNPRSMEDTIFFGWGRYIHHAFLLKVRHQEKPELDAKSFAPPPPVNEGGW